MSISPLESIQEHFAVVEDPRQERKVTHPLINLIFISMCGVLCGAEGWVAIEEFGYAQKEWLEKYINGEKGIPSHDILGKTFATLNPNQFREGFLS